jgi:hypothetical protein
MGVPFRGNSTQFYGLMGWILCRLTVRAEARGGPCLAILVCDQRTCPIARDCIAAQPRRLQREVRRYFILIIDLWPL